MKAILIKEFGAAEQMYIGEYPEPLLAEHEILIKVAACGVNRADILQRKGKYPPPKGASEILGLEVSGTVIRKGNACRKWNIGDRVCGILPGGGYAEFVAMHEDIAMCIPDEYTFEEAAAIPEAFLTAYQVLFWLAKLIKGNYVLVHAAASGVGTAAIQLIREHGATAIAVAGQKRKLDACLTLGAALAINYKETNFAKEVLSYTNQKGVNIIMDFIGAAFWEQNISALAMDGTIVHISTLGGSKINLYDLRSIMSKRATIIGTTLRGRDLEYKIALTQEFIQKIMPKLKDKVIKPVIDKVFKFEECIAAQKYMENNQNIGKIILSLGN